MDKMILELSTTAATSLGLNKYRKEILKVGHYVKENLGQEFDITVETLDHLIKTFALWIKGGNKVAVPLGHERANMPEFNRGWVESLFREGDSLFAVLELSDPELAATTDVSVGIDAEIVDGKGIHYKNVLTHVALTTTPVVGGLSKFTKLSLSIGETSMDFLKKLAEKLGIKDAEPTEAAVMLALEAKTTTTDDVDPLVKLVADNRSMKLSNLVKAGLLTPALVKVIKDKYVEAGSLALSMAASTDDGFDMLCDVLTQNKPIKLDEVTGNQTLELANPGTKEPNAMEKTVNKARKDAGLDK